MLDPDPSSPRLSDVAMWHKRSGLPDNVTDDGDIVSSGAGLRAQTEKQLLRAAIERLSASALPAEVRGAARLAASYLLAGDAETARRYLAKAEDLLQAEG